MGKTVKVTVIKKSGDKTYKGQSVSLEKHPKYDKYVKVYKSYFIHDEDNALKEGEEVMIKESKPLSKLKRWTVVREEK